MKNEDCLESSDINFREREFQAESATCLKAIKWKRMWHIQTLEKISMESGVWGARRAVMIWSKWGRHKVCWVFSFKKLRQTQWKTKKCIDVCGLSKRYKWSYLQNRNRVTDVENKLMGVRGDWDQHVYTAVCKRGY